MENLRQDMEFILEMEKMKSVLRMTKLIGKDEREDDAQHSWHISVMAMVLSEYAEEEVDTCKIIKMLLVHDIVEIYAGDTFAYDEKGYEDKAEREEKAADEIFSMLSNGKGREIRDLWEEFEAEETKEAQFATAMDRLQPILSNYYNDGGTWKSHNVGVSSIYKRVEPIKKISQKLWEFTSNLLEDACASGKIIDDRE